MNSTDSSLWSIVYWQQQGWTVDLNANVVHNQNIVDLGAIPMDHSHGRSEMGDALEER